MSRTLTTHGTAPLHLPGLRSITLDEIGEVLRLGWRDFMRRPSSILFLFILYPVIGAATFYIARDYDLVGLAYPLVAGFALIGPIASVGVMELSRRQEAGENPTLGDALRVFTGPARRGVLLMGLILFALFAGWIVAAQRILEMTLGDAAPADFGGFLMAAMTTPGGLAMFVIGNAIGFCFAVVALAISVVSMPMLVDGERSVQTAIGTSVRATLENPVPMAAWGAAVAGLLALGMLPVFAGLLIVLPVLGHANWHLYRRLVER